MPFLIEVRLFGNRFLSYMARLSFTGQSVYFTQRAKGKRRNGCRGPGRRAFQGLSFIQGKQLSGVQYEPLRRPRYVNDRSQGAEKLAMQRTHTLQVAFGEGNRLNAW